MARDSSRVLVEPLTPADLLALAQAHALDATTFPHSSLPLVSVGGPTKLWIARAEPGGPVIGFVGAHARGPVLEITGLAVQASHRRWGAGSSLLREVVSSAEARALAGVHLHVSTANTGAIRLYLDEGFRKERRLVEYYHSAWFPDDGDAWLMIRNLELPETWRPPRHTPE